MKVKAIAGLVRRKSCPTNTEKGFQSPALGTSGTLRRKSQESARKGMEVLMFDVNAIGSSVSATTLRDYVNQSFGQRSEGGVAVADDSVEISEIADLLSKLSELPESRARKIVEIRKALQ